MREIKFRAWNGKKMRYNVNINDGHCVRAGYQWFNTENDVYDSDPMQFTGQPDNNGVDIYDGDNVIQYIESEFLDSSDWRIIEGSVLFIDGEWCVGSTKYPLYGFPNRVIGHIHENKDLL
jgi:hypothetical protein